MRIIEKSRNGMCLGLCLMVTACGGGSSGSGGDDSGSGGNTGNGGGTGGTTTTYEIGGTLTGNTGAVVLSLNGMEETFDSTDFVFSNSIDENQSYTVLVVDAPTGQDCSITANQGVATDNVTSIAVNCADSVASGDFSVGGTITGTTGSVTLSLNGTQETFNSGNFTFAQRLPDNTAYSVLFVAAADNSVCSVANGTGVISQNISALDVNCSSSTGGNGRRLSRVERDYDNNGTFELVSNLRYNAGAEVVAIESNYTDDGEVDRYNWGNDGDISYFGSNYVFNSEGMPESFSLEDLFTDGSSEVATITYAYQGGLIESITTFFSDDTTSEEAALTPSYDGNRLVGLSSNVSGITSNYVFNYRADGSIESVEFLVNGVLTGTTDYQWRADGQIDRIEERFAGGAVEEHYQAHYDGNGRLVRNEYIDVNDPASEYNYTETVIYNANGELERIEYDVFSDGSVEATERFFWESGDCFDMYAPSFGSASYPNQSVGDSDLFPAGVFARVLGCED